ncbi:Uu.00g119500.m01.CDS01 [Anthostomella pinea]|uniref:Uu.00g119500.m01.CDS01 n=1 Tax=Anthostomella pinea TaxID=933095 RepID=A0AAI8VHB5_9PEZI|nr:Uu.00g119500.m01.CDS01 [Anthostomella pinea]
MDPPQNQESALADDGSDDASDKYIEAFGHRYHHSGEIFLPFDEDEQRRMEIQHRLFRRCLNGDLTATRLPLEIERILDLGSGTGVWPFEMAARYPQAKITGIDASPIQRTNAVPPNVEFVIDNLENPWPCPPASLDLVHARSIAGGVRNWPGLLKQAYDKLKPGGLFELAEIAIQISDFDRKFQEAEICPDFLRTWRDLSKKVGMEFDPTPHAPGWLLEAGFEKIVQRSEILPLGNWAKDDKLRDQQALMNEILSKQPLRLVIREEWLDEVRVRCYGTYVLAGHTQSAGQALYYSCLYDCKEAASEVEAATSGSRSLYSEVDITMPMRHSSCRSSAQVYKDKSSVGYQGPVRTLCSAFGVDTSGVDMMIQTRVSGASQSPTLRSSAVLVGDVP